MRLAIDARILYYPKCGIGNYVFNLVKNLLILDDSLEIFLFSDNPIHPSYKFPNDPRLKVIIFASSKKEKKKWIQRYLPKKLKEYNIDVYHATWNWGVPFLKSCPVVLTIHDLAPWILRGHFKNIRKEMRYKLRHLISARLADLIVSVSFNSKQDIKKLLKIKEQKIKVIYPGLDEEFEQCGIKSSQFGEVLSKYNLQENKYIIVPTGIDHPRRNPHIVLEGCKEILEKEDFKLVYTGNYYKEAEVYKKLIRRIEELSWQRKVIITGWILTPELVALISSAKIAIIPSLYEGFGLPILECFSCGVPLVASNINTIREIAQDGALYFNPYDPKDLFIKLVELLQNNDRLESMVKKGKERVKCFSWRRAANEMLEAYKSLLKC